MSPEQQNAIRRHDIEVAEEGLRFLAASASGTPNAVADYERWKKSCSGAYYRGNGTLASVLAALPKGTTLCIR